MREDGLLRVSKRRLESFPAPEPEERAETEDPVARLTDDELRGYLDRIPPREADALELRMLGCLERDIAVVLAPEGQAPFSQPSVNYWLRRGLERVRYLVWVDSLGLDADRVEAFAERLGCRPHVVVAAREVWRTQSYLGAAERIPGRSAPKARQAFMRFAWRVERAEAEADVVAVRTWLAGFEPRVLWVPAGQQWMRAVRMSGRDPWL